jgi:hypothetical protein
VLWSLTVEPGQADELATAVRELRALVHAQTVQIADLQAQVAGLTLTPARDDDLSSPPLVTGRRRFLALAGGAAAVAAGTLVSAARPVAAENLDPLVLAGSIGASAGVPTSTVLDYSLTSGALVDYFRVTDKSSDVTSVDSFYARYLTAAVAGHARTTPDRVATGVTGLSDVDGGNGVLGIATGAGGSYGVWGVSETGNGVVGRSKQGYDFFGDGAGRIGLSAHVFVGPPDEGTYVAADIIRDLQGALWACVQSGAPGVWRKLAGPTTAGAFHAVTPVRVYDSRSALPAQGLLETAKPRTIRVADGRNTETGQITVADVVPVGATAISCNITVTDTYGSGYAVVNPGTNAQVGSSTINWQPGQVLANAIIVGIDADRQVTLVVGGGGVTNIVVDVSGYFR